MLLFFLGQYFVGLKCISLMQSFDPILTDQISMDYLGGEMKMHSGFIHSHFAVFAGVLLLQRFYT